MSDRKRRNEAFYRQLAAEFRESGMTQRAFAAERGIPSGTLSSWFFKLRQKDAEAPGLPGLTKSQPQRIPAGKAGRSPFLPVRVIEPGPSPSHAADQVYELVMGRGVLRLPAEFDPVRVGALLRAAEVVC